MFEYYSTLNIPAVPDHIVDAVVAGHDSNSKPYNPPLKLIFQDDSVESSVDYYRNNLDQNCIDWIINQIPELANEQCTFGYQRISAAQDTSGSMFVHTDGAERGVYVVSYILDTGSNNAVDTHWWQEHDHDRHRAPHTFVLDYRVLDKLSSVTIPVNTWHMLDASILHSVSGIKTSRTAITVGFNNKELVDLILSKYKF